MYQALSHSPEVKRYEMRILQGMKIGNLMTEILREQSFTFKYVMDHSQNNLDQLQHAQVIICKLRCSLKFSVVKVRFGNPMR